MPSDPTTLDIERLIRNLPKLPVPSPANPGEERQNLSASDLQCRILALAGLQPASIIQQLREVYGDK